MPNPEKEPRSPNDPILDRVGPIRLLKLLKRGGMGDIFVGQHEILRRRVAVKMPIPERPDQDFLCHSLLREARALASVKHRNVVTIYDVGVLEDGTPYAVLELLDGLSLDRIIDSQGALPPSEVLRISAEVLAGMAAFHRQHYVMVDIKPDNVMVVGGPLVYRSKKEYPWIKLIDLGAVRMTRDPRVPLTVRLDNAVGSSWYMSPEAVLGLTLDARTDLYAFGILVYEMCTGRVPFASSDNSLTFEMHLYDSPPRLSSVCAWVARDSGLDQLVHTCLAKSPEDRPANVAEAFRLLRTAAADGASAAPFSEKLSPQELHAAPTLVLNQRLAVI
ncbi:MAG: serine/threonine-protein kinase [bacterium]